MLSGNPDYKNQRYDPYFNLLYGIVNRAIELKCSKIKLGQTAYWAKQQLGAYHNNMFIYYHCRKKLVFLIVKVFKKYLFPKKILKNIHVFKDSKFYNTNLIADIKYQ